MNDKLQAIQSELKAPKNQRNNFGNYNYRSCEDILEAVKPLLKVHGLTLVISDEVVNIGAHNYVKATATLSDGADKIEATAYAREAEAKKGMDDSQITGATSSYARKYALNGLFAIDDTKDADSQDNRSQAPKMAQTEKIDPLAKAKGEIMAKFQASGLNTVQQKAAIMQVLKKSTVDTIEEANEVLQALEDGAV
jgi:hypothetical protein